MLQTISDSYTDISESQKTTFLWFGYVVYSQLLILFPTLVSGYTIPLKIK